MASRDVADRDDHLPPFQEAGRTLFTLGLVREAEGNLSTFDGRTLRITRTGARLGELGPGDLVSGTLDGDLPGASTDLEVHRALYRRRGRGAVVHAHPAGTVLPGTERPGEHGIYEFGPTLTDAVAAAVRRVRSGTLR